MQLLKSEMDPRECRPHQDDRPMPCAISRIAGYFRHQIVMTSATATPLQRVLLAVRQAGGLSKTDRVAVDVDPVSLL